ncbi:serine protease [Sinomonas cellulolyticus]|uniref:S8/S53 family peptidase n=1 Tax=Sinomonas cellulolyticus TaxID=2801916 RepID=A0ABS1K3L2_9MICC|nr:MULTISPECIES: S53 family peptidase [Sinomonas]MBL0706038.1 S8/S53 family peptidase [Sinomonas cellulolyticus]GHG43167.1 serine protease [Sinomonas sp. KCTC 49339]
MAPHHGSHWLSLRALAATAAVGCALGLAAVGASSATAAPPNPPPSSSKSFPGSVPPWAGSRAKTGIPLSNTTVEGEIYLSLRDEAGAKSFATAVSTPGDAQYGQYLSSIQWKDQFAPAPADTDKVVSWLKAQGMVVTGVPASGMYVVFRGTVAQVNAAFAVTEQTYAFQGTDLIGPDRAPTVPAELASVVSAVSIDQGRLLTRPDNVADGADASPNGKVAPVPVATPCSHYWDEHEVTVPATQTGATTAPTVLCGYTPGQIQAAYGLGDGVAMNATAGAGQTVAIIDAYAAPSMLADGNQYSSLHGLPALTSGNYREVLPSVYYDQPLCGQPSGWQGEEALDVEAVHSTAPGASILYAGGWNCGGGLDIAMSKVLDGQLATIVSNSYGNVGEAVSPDQRNGEVRLHLQAAAEGIGLYFSSGDSGDEKAALKYTSPDFPASSPYVTSVGGTSLALDKSNHYLWETPWGTTRQKIVAQSDGSLAYGGPLPGVFQYGAGGGTSAVFDQPAYQANLVPGTLAQGKRVSPDVSALADVWTGFRIGFSPITNDHSLNTGAYSEERIGGTSLSCPLTAGLMASAQAATGTRVGFANPAIYQAAAASGAAMRDVTAPATPINLVRAYPSTGLTWMATLGLDTSLTATRGYDDTTGVGSMTEKFAQQVAAQH